MPQRSSFVRNNGLSLVLISLFALCWFGQSVAGYRTHNDERRENGRAPLSYVVYLRSPHFVEATAENWESEFVQMAAYVILTALLVQKGSAESKPLEGDPELDRPPDPNRPDAPAVLRRGGWRAAIYANSLALAFLGLFLISFAAHAVGGAAAYREEQRMEGNTQPITTWTYIRGARFWFESLQNWQSEFLAVFTIVVLSIFLRQRGSPESKPVDAPHSETGA